MKESLKSGRRARIADVAAAAGVSVSTVDRVINGRDPVRTPTARRVMEAAERLGLRSAAGVGFHSTTTRPNYRFGFLLLQKRQGFYQYLAKELQLAATVCPGARIAPRILHAENLAPTAVAAQIRALGRESDAIAIVSGNHPLISEALEEVAARRTPIFGLISEITTSAKVGFVGLDNYAVGRTAAWFVAQMARRAGKAAILIGTHRFRCQDLNESGFRSYFREHAPDFSVIEPGATLEDTSAAGELVRHLLQREPDLRALYMAGGGIAGALTALREFPRGKEVVVIGHDRNDEAYRGLIDGHIRALISHPHPELCNTLVDRMAAAVRGDANAFAPCVLKMHIETPESLTLSSALKTPV
jgi:LacI family transcriptional regulator